MEVGNVFISHVVSDTRFAADLARSLRHLGVASYTDADVRRVDEEPQAVGALAEALRAADYVVVIVSEKSVTSPSLNFEIGAAIGQEKQVIPVLLSRTAGKRFRVDWLRAFLSESVVAERTPAPEVARRIARRLTRAKMQESKSNRTPRRVSVTSRKRYHVTPDQSGWKVQREGTSRASARANTQAEAERRAKEMARRGGGGEVVIHGRDGAIRDSDTVPPARDPNPPRDTKH